MTTFDISDMYRDEMRREVICEVKLRIHSLPLKKRISALITWYRLRFYGRRFGMKIRWWTGDRSGALKFLFLGQ